MLLSTLSVYHRPSRLSGFLSFNTNRCGEKEATDRICMLAKSGTNLQANWPLRAKWASPLVVLLQSVCARAHACGEKFLQTP